MISMKLLYEYFLQFSQASRLSLNIAKSSIFFGGVPKVAQLAILDNVGFSKGELHVKYLGIPLSTKRLPVAQCQPLLDRILGKITSWTSKFLSYAGRLRLIKSILFSIQTFWCQIFILPKKILYLVETLCKRYLWTGGNELSKKALISWEKMYKPKSAGEFNIIDICIWNKAAICKHFWNLCKKKNRLWI